MTYFICLNGQSKSWSIWPIWFVQSRIIDYIEAGNFCKYRFLRKICCRLALFAPFDSCLVLVRMFWQLHLNLRRIVEHCHHRRNLKHLRLIIRLFLSYLRFYIIKYYIIYNIILYRFYIIYVYKGIKCVATDSVSKFISLIGTYVIGA